MGNFFTYSKSMAVFAFDGGELDMNDENVVKAHQEFVEAVSKGLNKQIFIDGMRKQ